MNVIIHKKASRSHSWEFRGKDGWSVVAAMDHYSCQNVVSKDTKTNMLSDTIKFRHRKLTLPSVTPEDKVIHGVQQLTASLKITPSSTLDAQLQAIKVLQDTIEQWEGYTKAPMSTTDLLRHTLSTQKHRVSRVTTPIPGTPPSPSMQSPTRVQPIFIQDIPANHQPISQLLRSQSEPKQLESSIVIEQPVVHCSRYRNTQKYFRFHPVLAAQRKYPAKRLNLWFIPRPEKHTAMSVL